MSMKSSTSKQAAEGAGSSSDSDAYKGINPLYATLTERGGSYRPQPKNTYLYEVKTSDTLAGIAARFNTTPSELVNLNKLGSHTIFPGQIIYVPEFSKPATPDSMDDSILKNVDKPVNGRNSPKPGHVRRVSCVASLEDAEEQMLAPIIERKRSPSLLAEDLNRDCLSKFLKISAKYITDGEGVVNGVLLVTPNHIMFDPNVSDHLVIEHGVDKYGVAAPMHMVVRAAIYPDIVRMKVKGSAPSDEWKSVKLYHSKMTTIRKSHSEFESVDPEKRLSSLAECPTLGEEDEEAEESSGGPTSNIKESSSFPDTCDKTGSPEKDSGILLTAAKRASLPDDSLVGGKSPKACDDPSGEEDDNVAEEEHVAKKKSGFEKTKQKFQKGLRKLSISDGLFPNSGGSRRMSLPASLSLPDFKLRKHDSSSHSNGKKSKSKDDKRKTDASTSFVNMVEEKADILTASDKLIPRPAKSFDDNPLYLCLRMGKPKEQSSHMRVSPVMDFGCKLKQEYWFGIPKSKVDNLYWFFLRWAPQKYGEIDDIDLDELGFHPISQDDEEPHDPQPQHSQQRRGTFSFLFRRRKSDDAVDRITHTDDPRSMSWEFLQHEELDESTPSICEVVLPELLQKSDILTEEHLHKLAERLPARTVGYPWTLIYSTSVHGFNLKTLYREMLEYDTPVLLVVASTTRAVFGAMLSHPLHVSDHFYGTGESFLFTFHPEFKCYHWTGENGYFIKGNTGSFAIGASDGRFGLWLDDDLFHGCTKSCKTYGNNALCPEEDFVVRTLECWGFV